MAPFRKGLGWAHIPEGERSVAVQGKTVLIVDDEWQIRFLISEAVKREGFIPLEASDAKSAVKIMQSSPIDIFLLDVDLNGMSGLQLCRKIREKDKVTTIIFVTGGDTTTPEAFAAGCDDIVAKPIEPLVLLARMTGHIQRTSYAFQLKRTHQMLAHYVSRRTREVVEHAAALVLCGQVTDHNAHLVDQYRDDQPHETRQQRELG
jgi:DNA-binding response OmpR family regulator